MTVTNEKDLSHETHEALSRLLATQPFYAVLLMDLANIVEFDKHPTIQTAATNGRDIFINTRFWKKLNLDERVFVLAHEVMHIITETCPRMQLYIERGFGPDLKPFQSMKFNKASDYVNNDILVQGEVGAIPKIGILHNPKIGGAMDLEDDVYQRLPDEQDSGDGTGHGGFDMHLPPDPNSPAPSKADVQRSVKGAAEAQKTIGNLPDWMKRMVDDICEPQVTWPEQIRAAIVPCVGRDQTTWSRPNKRRLALAPHIYLPGRAAFRAGTIVAFNDTSGSVSDAENKAFYSEMAGIYEELRPEQMYIGSCAMDAGELVPIQSTDDVRNYVSDVSGGTDMTAIFRKLDKEGIRPDALVILTDGETPFGEPQPYPVIWVITNKGIVAPHGKTVHIDAVH